MAKVGCWGRGTLTALDARAASNYPPGWTPRYPPTARPMLVLVSWSRRRPQYEHLAWAAGRAPMFVYL